ncbi:MAG: hypothetical protein CO149_00355 [Nitrospirae bacterium CG_4_9_14_3_um_filter_51_5]|nr:MAG: hypothetical protein CO149_00355 [Nitrospirae bacterium CG_4_9_14_3_um_filter_51_5]
MKHVPRHLVIVLGLLSVLPLGRATFCWDSHHWSLTEPFSSPSPHHDAHPPLCVLSCQAHATTPALVEPGPVLDRLIRQDEEVPPSFLDRRRVHPNQLHSSRGPPHSMLSRFQT